MDPEWTHVSSFSSVQGAVLFSEARFMYIFEAAALIILYIDK